MKTLFRNLFLGLFLLTSFVHAQEVRIVIDGGIDAAKPIAVVPFKWNGPGVPPADIADIIAADLRNSGKFNPIHVNKMPQQPTSVAEVNADAWRTLGVSEVIVGQVTPNGSGYSVTYQVVDTVGSSSDTGAGQVILQNGYNIPNNSQLRFGAHTVSDEVFERLTAIRGAFRTKIAYVVQRNSGAKPYELKVADYDGYNEFTIHRSALPIMSPAWSHDGKKVAYTSFENNKSQLVSQELSSGRREVISSSSGHNGAPSFSPDGNYIAFTSGRDGTLNIFVKNLRSGAISQLTRGSGNNTEPSWSPDSKRIVFTSDRSGSPQVYMMGFDGSSVSHVGVGARSYSGQITPDNQHLIMISGDSLIRKNLGTGIVERLGATFLDESPSISPNGIKVIYSSTQGLGKVLQLTSIDGRFKARLPSSGGQIKFPAWSPFLTKN